MDKSKLTGRTIQSLDRAILGLEMAFNQGIKPSDLAEKLSIDRSSAYRLLYTWTVHGYLLQDKASGKFFPNSVKFTSMSAKLTSFMEWTKPALSELKTLRDQTNETANLGVLDGEHVVFLAQELTHTAVIIINLLGRRRPAHCSALGKAILAFLPPEQLSEWIAVHPLNSMTPRSITSPEQLRHHLNEVRKQGFALDDEESQEGVRCIASPIFTGAGQVVGAMGISGPNSTITIARLPELTQSVASRAESTSRELGFIKGAADSAVIALHDTNG